MWDEIFINIRQLPVQMRTTSNLCRSVLVLISPSPCRLYFEEQSFVGRVSIHSFQGYFTHRGVTGSAAASSLWTSFRKNLILKVFEARFYRGEYSNLMGTGWWFVGWLADWLWATAAVMMTTIIYTTTRTGVCVGNGKLQLYASRSEW